MTERVPQLLHEFARPIDAPCVTFALLLRMIVPCWAHSYLGHGVRGAVFLIAYLPLLVYGLISMGSVNGAIALGLAFAVHASSLVDLLTDSEQSFRERLVVTPLLIVVALLGWYLMVGSAISQVASARALIQPVAPFERGDVVLFNRLVYFLGAPQPGDVVLYQVPAAANDFRLSPPGGTRREATYLHLEGERIDRIIAGPNSSLRLENGTLWVNDQPSEHRPLNPQHLPATLTLSVPENHYGILLTTDGYLVADAPMAAWQHFCVVPADHISGKVYLRNYPLSRWWPIR